MAVARNPMLMAVEIVRVVFKQRDDEVTEEEDLEDLSSYLLDVEELGCSSSTEYMFGMCCSWLNSTDSRLPRLGGWNKNRPQKYKAKVGHQKVDTASSLDPRLLDSRLSET